MQELLVEKDVFERVDIYLARRLDISRNKVQKLIKERKILINEREIDSSYKVSYGDTIKVNTSLDFSVNVIAEDIPLDIIYEDEYLMIINKKSGMVTHPAPGHYNHTLVNALMFHLGISESSNIRIGIVHRLDKDTSGLMVVAKNDDVLEILSNMIKNREINRHYLAIVEGNDLPSTATIDAPIGRDPRNREKMCVTDINSKNAITHIKVLERFKNKSLIECILESGRTHQIRVHMAYIKHPVVNDPIYNNSNATDFGQMLHSRSIQFVHPITKENIYFEQEPPKEFLDYLSILNEKN